MAALTTTHKWKGLWSMDFRVRSGNPSADDYTLRGSVSLVGSISLRCGCLSGSVPLYSISSFHPIPQRLAILDITTPIIHSLPCPPGTMALLLSKTVLKGAEDRVGRLEFGDSGEGSRKWGSALGWKLSGSRDDSRIGNLFLFFKFISLIGGYFLYNIVVGFAIHLHDSAMCLPMCLPTLNPPPNSLPTPSL